MISDEPRKLEDKTDEELVKIIETNGAKHRDSLVALRILMTRNQNLRQELNRKVESQQFPQPQKQSP